MSVAYEPPRNGLAGSVLRHIVLVALSSGDDGSRHTVRLMLLPIGFSPVQAVAFATFAIGWLTVGPPADSARHPEASAIAARSMVLMKRCYAS